MSALTPVGCFFLDTCVILSDILKENTSRIEKLKNDCKFHNIHCYISDSVKEESYEKVQQTLNFLGTVVRQTIKYSLEEFRQENNIPATNPMTSSDIRVLEELFSMYHNAVRMTRVGLPSPIGLIEEWAISFLGQRLDQSVTITIDQFLRELIKNLLALTSSIEDLYDDLVTFERHYVKIRTVTLDSRMVGEVKALGIHAPDCDHLASVVISQTKSQIKSVFVTLDFRSILSKRDEISQLGIECCDPLYGIHHLI